MSFPGPHLRWGCRLPVDLGYGPPRLITYSSKVPRDFLHLRLAHRQCVNILTDEQGKVDGRLLRLDDGVPPMLQAWMKYAADLQGG
jgi:hypothetical protein